MGHLDWESERGKTWPFLEDLRYVTEVFGTETFEEAVDEVVATLRQECGARACGLTCLVIEETRAIGWDEPVAGGPGADISGPAVILETNCSKGQGCTDPGYVAKLTGQLSTIRQVSRSTIEEVEVEISMINARYAHERATAVAADEAEIQRIQAEADVRVSALRGKIEETIAPINERMEAEADKKRKTILKAARSLLETAGEAEQDALAAAHLSKLAVVKE